MSPRPETGSDHKRRRGPDFSEYTGPRKRTVPVKARPAFGRTFWGKAFVRVVEEIGDKPRVSRGRTYARSGQVLALDITPGIVTAEVQGSQLQPFVSTLQIDTLDQSDIDDIITKIRRVPGSLAALVSGAIPDMLAAQLVPEGPSAFRFDCTCPDDGWPCKHAAAVAYLTAERIDTDPLQLLVLRGVDLDDLIGGVENESTIAIDIESWFGDASALPTLPRVEFRSAIDDLDPNRLRASIAALGLDLAQQNLAIAELRAIYREMDG
ncbi:SWIM zinc finger family protein [Rhodococcus sp. IEGM 1379]|uniref:SWIM zinc finger family protein n=1 Tax=Rhodococcus sp. IEGM 1379 TaxID=3047086 RepID=UPI0024B8501A|nr:SWIM zinc finger family protein [Rhodococcus sp. IEGM 1379]MDI9918316.1 SWIM zinc finger family protein [Rhodococcus sp. IEGM 1379]